MFLINFSIKKTTFQSLKSRSCIKNDRPYPNVDDTVYKNMENHLGYFFNFSFQLDIEVWVSYTNTPFA
jgi:redox-regulated HSP33 family molecular chaperone